MNSSMYPVVEKTPVSLPQNVLARIQNDDVDWLIELDSQLRGNPDLVEMFRINMVFMAFVHDSIGYIRWIIGNKSHLIIKMAQWGHPTYPEPW